MKLVEDISKKELYDIAELIGEAFVTNELFHEFGSIEERRSIVMRYMHIYVDCAYESKTLYSNEERTAFIGLAYSDEKAFVPQIKMLLRLLFSISFKKLKKLMKFANEIADGNKQYTKGVYLETLMVCVKKEEQGKSLTRELVNFAKEMATKRNVPLLFDTDMEQYASMYQHYGCELYHTKTACNGVTRYNLVWKPEDNVII